MAIGSTRIRISTRFVVLVTIGWLSVAANALRAQSGQDQPAQSDAAAPKAGPIDPSAGIPDDDVHRRALEQARQQPPADPHAGMFDPDDPHAGHVHEHMSAPSAPDPQRSENALRELREKLVPHLKLEDWRHLAVQHGGRYQTIEAWSRDVVKMVTGRTKFPKDHPLYDLDAVVIALELAFNSEAHQDADFIYIRDAGVRQDLTADPVQISDDDIRRVRKTGYVSFNFLNQDAVSDKISQLSAITPMQRAMGRVDNARFFFTAARQTLKIVPSPQGAWDAPWFTPEDLLANLGSPSGMRGASSKPVPGIEATQARELLMDYAGLVMGWQNRDRIKVNQNLAALTMKLPELAPAGVYPSPTQRRVDAFYHSWGAFTWVWGIYLAGLILSIWAVVSGWRTARGLALSILLIAAALHGLGLGLRWYILGRIPVANMFEAVVGSAWLGVMIALGLELRVLRARQIVYLLPVLIYGFIHNTMDHTWWYISAGIALFGIPIDMAIEALRNRFQPATAAPQLRGLYLIPACFLGWFALTLGGMVGSEMTAIAGILDTLMLRIHTVLIITSYAIVTLAFGVANAYLLSRAIAHRTAAAWVAVGCQIGAVVGIVAFWDGLQQAAISVNMEPMMQQAMKLLAAIVAGGLVGGLVPVVFQGGGARAAMVGAPGTASLMSSATTVGSRFVETPLLRGLDLSHLTLLCMANVGLFVGTILGAVWADYSWGRPWGWDPKEVFALTTWLIYAILIHVRLQSRDKGLWTSVVSVMGFAMMMFNWWAVNFFIVGLHSYA